MSDKPDEGDGAPAPADIPPTRKHEAAKASQAEPPARTSQLSMEMGPERFPDDGPLARNIRMFDRYLGTVEQGVLFALLAIVVLVAATAALSDKIWHHQLGRWWHYIVRGGTFSIAMFGAVFATYQQRHLAMDLVSRRLTPRGRLVLGTVLKVFTIFIAFLLFRSGMKQREVVGGMESLNLFGIHVTDSDIVTTMPIAAGMIIFHSLLHIVIDVEYLVRGKLPPERARSGH